MLCLVWGLALAPGLAVGAAQPEQFKGLRVESFRLEGAPKALSKPLRQGLVLSGESGLLSTRYPVFYPKLLAADLERTRLYLARHGYPYAQVEPELERDQDHVHVSLRVDPGPPVTVASVRVSGLAEPGRSRAEKASLVVPGQVFRQGDYEATRGQILAELSQLGYAAAQVTPSVERLDSTRVAVGYDVDPGRVHYFGEVKVAGVPSDLGALARRSLVVERGRQYSGRDVTQARDDLRLLGLFRQVRLETAPGGRDTLHVLAQLTEREPRTVELGAGYWTDEGIRGHARWVHRNLFRGGRGLEFKGSASQYLIDAETSTWWPSLLGPRTRVTLRLRGAFHNEDSYEQFTTGTELSAAYRISAKTQIRGGVQISNSNVVSKTTDPVFLENAGLITSLLGSFRRDGSDDQLYPKRGSITEFQGELAPSGPWTDNAFARGWVQRSDYFLLPRETVLAAKVAFGAADPLGKSLDLLPDRRFFSGGATSNRGFQRNRLGPKDSEGNPIGGGARMDLSAELRFKMFWLLEAAVFADVGQVWSTVDRVRLSELKAGAGPAIIVRTPVGPVRADLGFRISDVDTHEPRRVLHILIGNPF